MFEKLKFESLEWAEGKAPFNTCQPATGFQDFKMFLLSRCFGALLSMVVVFWSNIILDQFYWWVGVERWHVAAHKIANWIYHATRSGSSSLNAISPTVENIYIHERQFFVINKFEFSTKKIRKEKVTTKN